VWQATQYDAGSDRSISPTPALVCHTRSQAPHETSDILFFYLCPCSPLFFVGQYLIALFGLILIASGLCPGAICTAIKIRREIVTGDSMDGFLLKKAAKGCPQQRRPAPIKKGHAPKDMPLQ